MKRKDWKIKDLKEDFYGRKTNKKSKYFLKSKFFFLRRLYIRRCRFLNKKNLMFNYVFYRSMLNFYKLKKQNYIFNIFFKNYKYLKTFYPEYSVYKNVFNKKIIFKEFSKKNNFKYIFLPNKYVNFNKNNFGLNLYNYNLYNNKNKFEDLIKNLDDDSNKNLIQFKYIEKNLYFYQDLNFYFNYNLNNLNLIELYKILILLYVNKLNIKYI